ncbi:MAG TPA: hypothetical protein VM537_13190 [Anaerolineae bacterium]|nr:hypothetical protein [Anaerolineae bacterium]
MIRKTLRRFAVRVLAWLGPCPPSVVASRIGLVPGTGRIRVLDELAPDQHPIEIHIHRSLLIEANAKMHPRDTANAATVAGIMDAIIYLTAAAILADIDIGA